MPDPTNVGICMRKRLKSFKKLIFLKYLLVILTSKGQAYYFKNNPSSPAC